jgi:Flp pilus assembly protein TadG
MTRRIARSRGQSLVEATLVLLVFFGLLLGVVDCGQVMYSRQVLQERVRAAARWGSVHPFDGTGEQVANMVLYGQIQTPPAAGDTLLGLTRKNIDVRANDGLLTVAIVNYQTNFFSPWISKPVISARPVVVTAPMTPTTPQATPGR